MCQLGKRTCQMIRWLFLWCHHKVHSCHLDWNMSTIIIKIGSDIRVCHGMNCSNSDPLTFHVKMEARANIFLWSIWLFWFWSCIYCIFSGFTSYLQIIVILGFLNLHSLYKHSSLFVLQLQSNLPHDKLSFMLSSSVQISVCQTLIYDLISTKGMTFPLASCTLCLRRVASDYFEM